MLGRVLEDVARLLHGEAAQRVAVDVDDLVVDTETAVPAKKTTNIISLLKCSTTCRQNYVFVGHGKQFLAEVKGAKRRIFIINVVS